MEPPAMAEAAADRDTMDWGSRPVTVRTENVVKEYVLGKSTIVRALKGITLQIRQGEYISIMGPSGSGKTTLFNMVGGLDQPSAGKVFIDGVDVSELDEWELAWLRCRKIGYIFQTFNLIPVMTALENVTLPMIFAGAAGGEAEERGLEILGRVGLRERARHKPYELSGGQQQRVAIARAFANDPAIILADEPTGNLDLKTGKQIIELLKGMNREQGVTVITATHDLKMLSVSDRIVWVRDGLIDRVERREEIQIDVGTIGGEEVA
jgi:putative ABC transport system ATP-binding protein